jgi:signal peptidase
MGVDVSSINWRRGLHILGVLALAAFVLPFVSYAVPSVVGATGSYIVVSDSMNAQPAPVIQAGDVVYVYDTPTDQIEEGDIITYDTGGKLVKTHRVVDVQTEDGTTYFETKGDNNEEADPGRVSEDQVVGTVQFVVPQVGRLIVFASSSLGMIAFVIIPMSLLLVSEIANLAKRYRASRETESAPTGDQNSGGETNDD